MCRNKKPQKVRLVNKEDNNQDYSDSDSDGYCYGVKLTGCTESINTVRGSYVTVNLNDKKLKLLADSGSSVNILDETDYEKIGKPALHKGKTHGKSVPYGVKDTIKVLGTSDVKIGIGKFRGQQVKIYIDESVPPVAQKPRRTPFNLRSKVSKKRFNIY
ncbi:uncharacterized protein LOC134270725 [Saccostrea cucullata]|uniref:uncharacterized protein LOC134270725 n=1 Tax=Saccostrea cuccullata TaxID=36930 RepID=UPI002ED1019D